MGIRRFSFGTAVALSVAGAASAWAGNGQLPRIATPISLSGVTGNDLAISVNGPSGSSSYTYLMFVEGNRDSLVPIEAAPVGSSHAKHREFLFSREVHGDCLHQDARYFRTMTDGTPTGFYVVESLVEWGKHPKLYGDFAGASVTHRLFRFERADAVSSGRSRFRQIAEVRERPVKCRHDRLAGEIERLFPSGALVGRIEP